MKPVHGQTNYFRIMYLLYESKIKFSFFFLKSDETQAIHFHFGALSQNSTLYPSLNSLFFVPLNAIIEENVENHVVQVIECCNTQIHRTAVLSTIRFFFPSI